MRILADEHYFSILDGRTNVKRLVVYFSVTDGRTRRPTYFVDTREMVFIRERRGYEEVNLSLKLVERLSPP